MRALLASATLILPTLAFAAGGGSSTPPKQTNTTAVCENGMVWDEKTEACVAPQESRLDDKTLYEAAREFAYAGQYQNTLDVLDAMSDQQDDGVLTYRGFANRKLGDWDLGMAFYAEALAINPDNLLARSYMGQAFVEDGQIDLAQAQLTEIRTRGGRGTWAEFSLRQALESGRGYSY
jgi:tetratricopeptide (TPR) repeat protein